jgi:hypothetical protein
MEQCSSERARPTAEHSVQSRSELRCSCVPSDVPGAQLAGFGISLLVLAHEAAEEVEKDEAGLKSKEKAGRPLCIREGVVKARCVLTAGDWMEKVVTGVRACRQPVCRGVKSATDTVGWHGPFWSESGLVGDCSCR